MRPLLHLFRRHNRICKSHTTVELKVRLKFLTTQNCFKTFKIFSSIRLFQNRNSFTTLLYCYLSINNVEQLDVVSIYTQEVGIVRSDKNIFMKKIFDS